MAEKGTNILPMIGFIILILVLFTGFMLFGKRTFGEQADDGIKNRTSVMPRIINGYDIDESREISLDDKDTILIKTSSAEVNIYTHTDNRVKAHLHGKVKTTGKEMIPELKLEENGRIAIAEVRYPQGFNIFYSADLQLDVTIPESWVNTLNISTVSGNINAQILPGTDIRLKSSSGYIRIHEIKGQQITIETVSGKTEIEAINGEEGLIMSTSGDLHIGEAVFSDKFTADTVSGSCRINLLECTKTELQTSSGDIEVRDGLSETVKSRTVSGKTTLKLKNGSAELETASGNIKAEFEEGFSSVKVKSVSGDVQLTLPADSQFSLDIRTVSGRMNCSDFPVRIESSNDKSLKGVVGDGRSSINVSTASGNVIIGK